MRNRLILLLAIALLCLPDAFFNHAQAAATAHSAGPLASCSTLIIRDFTTDNAEISNVLPDSENKFIPIRKKVVKSLTDHLVSRLQGSFPQVLRYGDPIRNPSKTVIVEGSFTAIDAGRRGLQMWIGFSGTASATVKAKVIDAATGKVLNIFIKQHSEALGWSGSERVLLHITDQLAQDMAEYLKKLR